MAKFTEEEISEIRCDYQQAKNPQKQIGILSQIHLCSKEDIREIVKDIAGKQDYRTWSEEDIVRLMELQKEGKGIKEIAETLNRTESGVQQKLKRLPKEKREPEVKLQVEILTERITIGKISAILHHEANEVVNVQYDGNSCSIPISGADEMANFWKLIAERAGKK